ncbi:hypothetical protein YC2023_024108 [Brassica napus]
MKRGRKGKRDGDYKEKEEPHINILIIKFWVNLLDIHKEGKNEENNHAMIRAHGSDRFWPKFPKQTLKSVCAWRSRIQKRNYTGRRVKIDCVKFKKCLKKKTTGELKHKETTTRFGTFYIKAL